MTAEAALNEDEQKLFEQMQKEDGAKDAPKQEEKPATKAEEKPAPEAKVEENAKPDEKKPETMIPKAALDEARSQNKELRSELKAMKELVAEGDKKLQALVEKLAKQAETPAPKFEDDPAGALKHENEQLKKSIAEIKDKLDKHDQAAAQGSKLSEFKSVVDAKESAFAKEHPDYWDAASFVAEQWRYELSEAGYEEAEIPKHLFAKSVAITGKAVQAGRDPAAAIYNLAKKFGFTGTKPAVTEKQEEKKPDGKSKLEQIAKGQELAKGGGGGGPDELSITSLAQMDDEQLDKLVADKDWWAKNIKHSPLH